MAAGGTVKAVARLVAAAAGGQRQTAIHGAEIGPDDLAVVSGRLLAASRPQRLRMPGMDPRRAGTIGAGAVVLGTLVAVLRLRGLTVSCRGLREGIVLETAGLAVAPAADPAL